jgi:hypothetical protein
LTTTDSLIADLEAGLAAAKALAAGDMPQAAAPAASAVPAVDTSMMPGGADSAPVTAIGPPVVAKAEAPSIVDDVEHAVETEGLDLMYELKEGKTVKEVAHLVSGAPDVIESIVRAISDIAQGVRI